MTVRPLDLHCPQVAWTGCMAAGQAALAVAWSVDTGMETAMDMVKVDSNILQTRLMMNLRMYSLMLLRQVKDRSW